MLSRLIVTVAIGVFTVAGLADYASAFDEPIPIKISLLKWGGNPPVGKLYKLVSKPAVPPFPLPTGLSDPLTQGGSLTVTIGGAAGSTGTLSCDLQAGAWNGTRGWKALGNPAGSKGYKYINKEAGKVPGADPCKIAIIKEKVIKVLAKNVGSITVPVDNPPGNGDVEVSITAGSDSYCALAAAEHYREKADKLIKMKDQPAPASCPACGDNVINQPSEECDGTDDGACTCAGTCLPPGDPNECTCAPPQCGNDCIEAGEQCDGTDAAECEGLCLANCTCPEPICNNGVKEVGEVCDPAGSTTDCPTGQICGGFCECVPNEACNCGSTDPTMYQYKSEPPVPGSVCGTTDGDVLTDLKCMSLYIGSGASALPQPAALPDSFQPKFNIAQCLDTDLTLAPTSPAQVGPRSCTEGKRCVGGDNDGDPCVRDRHCPLGTCVAQCFYSSYITILNKALPAISTCISIEIAEDASGGVDCETGKAFTRVPLDAVIHLTLLDQSPSTPGHNACPICVGGTLGVPASGTCEGGPSNGQPCMPESTQYDLRNCCAGGGNNSKDCTEDSDCPGSTCVSGCSLFPTALDCPPQPLAAVGPGLLLNLAVNTEDETAYGNTAVANQDGYFCGWCRDLDDEGSGCFEGDPDEPSGGKGCPDSSIIACRPETYHGPGGGDLADKAECGDGLTCRTDADCTAPYETCGQRDPGAYGDATIRTLVYDSNNRPGDLRDFNWHASNVASNFCIAPSFDDVIDGDSDLGGPGAAALIGKARLSPSGAFMDATSGLLD